MNIYQEELIDHYRNSRHRGIIENPDFDTGESNPSCGDLISMQGNIKEGILVAVAFQGKGCVISQAAASMLCASVIHQPIDKINVLDAEYMLQLVKIPLGPTRLKCALLSLYALKKGIAAYQSKV